MQRTTVYVECPECNERVLVVTLDDIIDGEMELAIECTNCGHSRNVRCSVKDNPELLKYYCKIRTEGSDDS